MNTKLLKKNSGFSLVEMLVVIAVIGIIAAIAVPNIGRINDAATDSKDMRNAQNIASVFAAAQAAGLDFNDSEPGHGNGIEADTIAAVVAGDTVTDPGNPFDGTFFGVPGLAADDITGADAYLSLQNGVLQYDTP